MTPAKRIELAAALFGWTPHPSQREWLLDGHPVRVAACGRRWGKTEAAAVDVATFAAAFDGSVQMIVAPTYDQTKRELIDNLAVRLAHQEIVYPRIEPLIEELQFYEYEITNSGHVRTQARRGQHDDCVCALALALRIGPRFRCSGGILTSSRKTHWPPEM